MFHVILLSVLLAEYPYSLTPGGVKADYYASHDFAAWVDLRFGGEIYWAHTTIRKGEGLTRDGRRARCGNHFLTALPPGAKQLPPAFNFIVPISDQPLPGINDEPPAIPTLAPPALTPIAGPIGFHPVLELIP
jgi:hypothetical protein